MVREHRKTRSSTTISVQALTGTCLGLRCVDPRLSGTGYPPPRRALVGGLRNDFYGWALPVGSGWHRRGP